MTLRAWAGVLLLLAAGCGQRRQGGNAGSIQPPPHAPPLAQTVAEPRLPAVPDAPHGTAVSRAASAALALQLGHADAVTAVAFDPSGKLLASASIDATVKLWDVGTGGEIRTLAGHRGTIWSIAFSPDGSLLASASVDTTAILWEAKSGREVRTLRRGIPRNKHEDDPPPFCGGESVAFSPDGGLVACGYADGQIIIWETGTGRVIRQWNGGDSLFGALVAFSPDGKVLAATHRARSPWGDHDDERGVELREVRTGALVRTITTASYLEDCLFSPDGRMLAAGSGIYEVATGREVRQLASGGVQVAAFSPDGKLLACSALERPRYLEPGMRRPDRWRLELWDAKTGEQVRTLSGQLVRIRSHVAFSPDGTLMAAGSGERNVSIWDVGTGRQVRVLAGRVSGVQRVAWSPAGSPLAVLTKAGSLLVFDLHAGTIGAVPGGPAGNVNSIAFSPDGRLVGIGVGNDIEVREASSGHLLQTLAGHTEPVISLAFSPDGRTLASGSWDTSARFWDAGTGRLLQVLPGQRPHRQAALPLRPGGEDGWRVDLAVSGPEGWGEARLATSGTIAPGVVAIAFSPDGSMVATAAIHYAALWETATGRRLRIIDADYGTYAIAFSPAGELLASGMWDGAVRLWQAKSGQRIAQLTGHEGDVNQLTFDPKGDLLASCAYDPAVRLWDVSRRGEARILSGHTCSVESVAFSPSGHLLASGSSDGSVRVWDTTTSENRGTVCLLDEGREWIALDAKGHYDCSRGAESAMAWRVGTELFASQELAATRRRPRLLAQVRVSE